VDILHIFCTEGAGTPIKAYSPEIIVHPVWKESSSKNEYERGRSEGEKVKAGRKRE
jgi:hypothetical protein